MQFARRRLLSFGLVSAAAALPASDLARRLAAPAIRTAFEDPDAPTPTTDTASRLAQAFVPSPAPPKPAGVRRASVHNLHTGDKLDAVYYENGRYVPQVMLAAMRVLRDWRDGEEHVMDPRLFDLLHTLGERLSVNRPFQVLSGYRSKTTNALMHERSPQVAAKSQHVLGKALDICLEGVDLARLHRAALSLRAGGVGFYPQSGFVHVDVGPMRQWVGT
jgi:uncharacterized protein YcbK (DUF882 family)